MRQFRIDGSERERILNLHESATKKQYLSEQTPRADVIRPIQCFLNKVLGINIEVDGMTGPDTEGAITDFQRSRDVYPSDGVWGPITAEKMTEEDREVMRSCKSEEGDLIDKFLGFLGIG